jgi:SAM-dependent methyltransferase
MKAERDPDYLEVNKKHWDITAKRNYPEKAEFLRWIRDNEPYLEKIEPKIFPYLQKIKGKKIIVPQFGDALALLACAKRGAIVTGVDFSSEQVRLARESAKYCKVNVTLVKADWEHLPKSVPINYFHFAVAECGIFVWMKNLDAWMKNAYRVLRTGGRLVVTDFHPFELITEQKEGKTVVKRSYFDQCQAINHLASSKDAPPSAEFLWKLSDIVNAAIAAGLRIDRIEEFCYREKTVKAALVPTDFLIVATKK